MSSFVLERDEEPVEIDGLSRGTEFPGLLTLISPSEVTSQLASTVRTFHSATLCCSSVVDEDDEEDFLCCNLRKSLGEGEGFTLSGDGGTDGRRNDVP